MQTSPCKQKDTHPTQPPSHSTTPQRFFPACILGACANCPIWAVSCSWRQRWHFVFACKVPCSPVVLQERHFENRSCFPNAPLQMHFDYSCGEEQYPPIESCGLRCSFWRINWGYAKDIKSPKEINLQIHPTSPQLPYVSHSISNCP